MPNVKAKMIEREAFFNAPDFVPRMVNVLNIVRSEWFRWFDSRRGRRRCAEHSGSMQADARQATLDSVARVQGLDALYRSTACPITRSCVCPHMVDGPRPKVADHVNSPHRNQNPARQNLPGARAARQMRSVPCVWSGDVPNVSYHIHTLSLARESRARLSYARQASRAQARRAAGADRAGPFHTYAAQGRRRTGQRPAIHGSWALFHRQIKIHRRSRGHGPRKNSHRHIAYAPNAKQSAWLIRICDYSW